MEIKYRQLVSINTARIKLRDRHPRIAEDLRKVFEMMKDVYEENMKEDAQ